MATDVNGAFETLISWATASSAENARAKQHRFTIDNCLKNKLGMSHSFRSGSFGNLTNVAGYSDVDLFAVFPTTDPTQNSDTFLQKMRTALKGTLPNTDVRVRSPAVVVPFGDDEQDTFEVVPADFAHKTSDDHNVYDIPDRAGDWMKSSPAAHNAYVRRLDEKLGGNVRPLIRLIKTWKYYSDVPIRSFYLEMRTAEFAAGESTIIYKYDVRSVLRRLDSLELAYMLDPLGISGRIYPGTASQVETAKTKVNNAARRAQNAIESEQSGNLEDAFSWWDKVFNGQFPSYY